MTTGAQEEQFEERTHSGRFIVRMPPALHTELAHEAEREGVSLNTLIIGVLAGAVGWRAPDGDPDAPRWARATLTANLVVVAVLAAAAVALVIAALAQG